MMPSERERMDGCWRDDRALSVCNDDCARIREIPLLRERVLIAEAAANDLVSAIHHEVHGRIQTIRGMCTDEEPRELIDVKLRELDEVVYRVAVGQPVPSFSGE